MSRLVGTESPRGPDKAAGPLAALLSPEQQIAEAMSAEPVRRVVVITNPQGFHMRPMSAFVQMAQKYQCNITVMGADGQRVDGKSMFGLMGLGAEQGTELTLEADGPDGAAALEALADVLCRVALEEGGPPAS